MRTWVFMVGKEEYQVEAEYFPNALSKLGELLLENGFNIDTWRNMEIVFVAASAWHDGDYDG